MTVAATEPTTASVLARAEVLLAGMDLADKAGMMFHTMIQPNPDGSLMTADNALGVPGTEELIVERRIRHVNVVGTLTDPRAAARWHNTVQQLAADSLSGIPVTFSSDPRHSFTNNVGTGARAGFLSQWPESLGFAAIGDPDRVQQFADMARQEYLSIGLRTALHPQIDLATEPRWSRIVATFGESAELTSALAAAYVRGFQGSTFGTESVSTMTKHFPGGGPQLDGEDPHFSYGREQVYPGGRFDYHLEPFKAAIAAGTRQMMPYYGMPVGTPYEEVAFGFNRGIVTDLLRGQLGFDGIVCTDWGLLTDSSVFGEPRPARAWGVEDLSPMERAHKALDAGVDQFGGEHRPEILIELVERGRIPETRLDGSVRRLLIEKLMLGLFDDAFVDEEHAVETAARRDFSAAGELAQRDSVVVLKRGSTDGSFPIASGLKVYAEGVDLEVLKRYAVPVEAPVGADVILVRLAAPYEPRSGAFEQMFHAGSLAFRDDEIDHVASLAATAPVVVDVYLDRPAVLTRLVEHASALTATFGVSDEAWLDVVFGRHETLATLPFDLPRSMEAVLESPSDAPFATTDPLYSFGSRG